MPSKRKVKMNVEERKKIKIEAYCILCQKYGHIISEECVTKAVCHNCGTKGHVRRDCEEENLRLKDEVKKEKLKLKDEVMEEKFMPKDEVKEQKFMPKDKVKEEKLTPKDEVKEETLTPKDEAKFKVEESRDSENEYVEMETPKDEPDSESDCEIVGIKKDIDTDKEYIEKDNKDEKKVKIEVYCLLCQMYGHTSSEDCLSNATCFACGRTGHIGRDCDAEEYTRVEVEVDKREAKTEMNLECSGDGDMTALENNMITSSTTNKDNVELSENYVCTHSLKKCSVKLQKMNRELREEASRLSKSQPKRKNISPGSQKRNVVPKHISIQVQHDGVLQKCKKCIYKTKNKGDLKRHIQAQHEGVLHYCKQCNFMSNYGSSLSRHIHADHEGRLHSCKMCDYQTKHTVLLKTHIQAEHEGVLHSCKTCDYKTKFKGHLTRHIQVEHDGVRHSCKKVQLQVKVQS